MAGRPPAVLDASNPTSPLHYKAGQTAVLLMDYQNLIIGMYAGAEEKKKAFLEGAQKLRDWARKNNVLLVHATIDLSQKPSEERRMGASWGMISDNLSKYPHLANVHGDVQAGDAQDTELEVSVSRKFGGFNVLQSQGLVDLLQKKGIKSLVLSGISTSGCLLSTTRAAADDGFVVTVIEDGCADMVEGLHENLIKHVLPASANVTDFATWEKEFASA